VLGASFFVMDFVEGETIGRKILRDAELATARSVLPEQLADAAARIHTIDAGVVGLRVADDAGPGAAELARYTEVLRTIAPDPHPALELAIRWLGARLPAPRAATLVHGDYRMGNVIVGPNGLRAVLDWELAHAGDPMEDLGWLCVARGASAPTRGPSGAYAIGSDSSPPTSARPASPSTPPSSAGGRSSATSSGASSASCRRRPSSTA
jgi:aminoglycoside phosphotransferase (APT) family kinase protein